MKSLALWSDIPWTEVVTWAYQFAQASGIVGTGTLCASRVTATVPNNKKVSLKWLKYQNAKSPTSWNRCWGGQDVSNSLESYYGKDLLKLHDEARGR